MEGKEKEREEIIFCVILINKENSRNNQKLFFNIQKREREFHLWPLHCGTTCTIGKWGGDGGGGSRCSCTIVPGSGCFQCFMQYLRLVH